MRGQGGTGGAAGRRTVCRGLGGLLPLRDGGAEGYDVRRRRGALDLHRRATLLPFLHVCGQAHRPLLVDGYVG